MSKRKNNVKLARKQFNAKPKRFVLYSNVPALPQEYDTVVVSAGTFKSALAQNSISQNIVSNSLLQGTAQGWSFVGQSPNIVNIAKNYASYRVVKYNIQLTAISKNAADTLVTVLHVSEDPAYNGGSTFNASSAAAPFSQFFVVPSTSNMPNVVSRKATHTIDSIAGTENVLTDDDYSGDITTAGVFSDPTKTTFVILYQGLASGAAFTANTAPTFEVKFTQWVKFFDRRN